MLLVRIHPVWNCSWQSVGEDPWAAYPQMVSRSVWYPMEAFLFHVHLPKLSQPSTVWVFKILHMSPRTDFMCLVWLWYLVPYPLGKFKMHIFCVKHFHINQMSLFAVVTPGCPSPGNVLLVLLLFFSSRCFCWRDHWPHFCLYLLQTALPPFG